MSLFDFKGLSKGEKIAQYAFATMFFGLAAFLFLAAWVNIGGDYSAQCRSVSGWWKVPGLIGYGAAVWAFSQRHKTDNNLFIGVAFVSVVLGALSFAGFFS